MDEYEKFRENMVKWLTEYNTAMNELQELEYIRDDHIRRHANLGEKIKTLEIFGARMFIENQHLMTKEDMKKHAAVIKICKKIYKRYGKDVKKEAHEP